MKGQPSKGRWAPLGGALAVGFFKDCFGDSNALVARAALEDTGGFTAPLYGGVEDSTGACIPVPSFRS